MADDARYAFTVEWYEEIAARTRTFQFFYFAQSKTIEMFDIKTRKMFLKTGMNNCPLELKDLYLGASINVLGRQLKIVDFGDDFTKRSLSNQLERTLAMIKPDCLDKMGDIIDTIYARGLLISKMRTCRFSQNDAYNFFQEKSDQTFMKDLIQYISSGPVLVMELVGENAIQRFRELIGPTDPSQARSEVATSLRARFGRDILQNAVHGSADAAAAARELERVFGPKAAGLPNCVVGSGCTCCLIKPHAVKAGMTGKIICAIQEAGYTINTIQMFNVEKANVEEFYEVYKGVVHEYPAMVNELVSGPVIAMEILGKTPSITPEAFRETCGPPDPEIARHLRPQTIRALFGQTKVQNAVHCTDLPEDGPLEVEYFFKVLDRPC